VFAVAIMRAVAVTDRLVAMTPGPKWLRPAVGGVLLAGLAVLFLRSARARR